MSFKIMPLYGNLQCLSFCQRAAANGRDDEGLGRNLAIMPWIDAIEALIDPLTTTLESLQFTYATYRQETAHSAEAAEKMARTVRDFLSVLVRRVRREDQPEYLLSYYMGPNQGLAGKKSSRVWYQMGQMILAGEAKALRKGFPPMANPSVADVTRRMEAFDQSLVAAEPADRNCQQLQLKMKDLRKQVRLAARGLAATLRVLLSDEEPGARRRVMRSYGFRFRDGLSGAPRDVFQPPLEPDQESPDPVPRPDHTVQDDPDQAVRAQSKETKPGQNTDPNEQITQQPSQGEQVQQKRPLGHDRHWILSPKRALAG